MDYRLIRSDRRTLSIEINAAGELIVRAPKRAAVRDIEGFIELKRDWILAKQTSARERAGERGAYGWRDGAYIPYLGGRLRVRLADVRKPELRAGELLLPQKGDARTQGRRWLMQRADEKLAPLVTHWARATGLIPKRLEWSGAKKRWGSMSSEGTLRLNLALMHCPESDIEYVIVHELAHMRVPNHSPEFYALVRSYLPDADARRASMKDVSWYTLL